MEICSETLNQVFDAKTNYHKSIDAGDKIQSEIIISLNNIIEDLNSEMLLKNY